MATVIYECVYPGKHFLKSIIITDSINKQFYPVKKLFENEAVLENIDILGLQHMGFGTGIQFIPNYQYILRIDLNGFLK